ncbi:MAG: 4Fe-4S dicluster domain-containing protein [Breznakibacter sp.]|nr:4Fe-4S dicluster domain-containing protein [Breznakibacter sp.]
MINFGYATKKSNQVSLDASLPHFDKRWEAMLESSAQCIQCGCCSGSCASPYEGKVSFREVVALWRRGLTSEANDVLKNCINCSKCQLVCPSNVESRKIIYSILQIA